MKLKFDITITANRANVWAAFDNQDNLTRWQPTLKSFTHVSGERGQPGAVSKLVYDRNGREIAMTETITERRAPDFLAGVYESDLGTVLIVNHFSAIDDNSTRWESWSNFRFRGVMKFLSLFLAKSMRKRTCADMQRFKLVVETDIAAEQSG